MFALCSAMLASAASAAVYKVDESMPMPALPSTISTPAPTSAVFMVWPAIWNLTVPNAKAQSISYCLCPNCKPVLTALPNTWNLPIFQCRQIPWNPFCIHQIQFQRQKTAFRYGNLTMNGKTAPVKLKADKFNCYQSPMLKAEVCGGDFSTTIDRTKWGLDYLVSAGMSKKVNINIQIEAVKQ